MVTHRIKNSPNLVVVDRERVVNLNTGAAVMLSSDYTTALDFENLGLLEPTETQVMPLGVHITDAKESLSKAIQQISAAILNRFFTTDCEPVNEYLLLENITFSTIPNTKTTEGAKDEV